MSQPSQEHPMAPNSVESTETGPTSVQETLTTEGGDGNSEPGEDLQARLGEADELKQEGNDLFRRGKWNEAMQSYRSGLAQLPERRNPPTPPLHSPPATDEEGDALPTGGDADRTPAEADHQTESTSPSNVVDSPLEGECAKARSVLNANIAACHMKLGENEDAVKACTEALQDDSSYVRALQRRAQCNEKIGSWSALGSAKEDYNTLVTLLPPSSDQVAEVKRSLRSLEPRLEEAQKREVGEMVDKLKGLGNSVLGRFGLSTDNFKFEPNGQGGYSLNFSR